MKKIIVVCAALVVDGDSLLLIQEAKKSAKRKWNIPGGHSEPDEDEKKPIYLYVNQMG